MKWSGGYTLKLQGRPSREVRVLPEASSLCLPLATRRFSFSALQVKDGEAVCQGAVLASDPSNFHVPLLAPRSATIDLKTVPGAVVLKTEHLSQVAAGAIDKSLSGPLDLDSAGRKRLQLLSFGAWQFFTDAYTGRLPDPMSKPQAIIVSTMQLTPYLARGDVQLGDQLDSFTRGLEHLQTFLDYQPIFLIIPKIDSEFARRVKDSVRGYAWIKPFVAPLKYPFDNCKLLVKQIGLAPDADKNPVWFLRTEGVLAVDEVLTRSHPVCDRLISIGGPGVDKPMHLRLPTGYPIGAILEQAGSAPSVRIINGGIFNGTAVDSLSMGIDAECAGLTTLPDIVKREFMSFVRPGFNKSSYSNCFASLVRPPFQERLSTATNGEPRACVGCGFCSDICPARIYPSAIHKALYQGSIELAERFRIDLCIECGLCSYACPSKIELGKELAEARETIRKESHQEDLGG